jgi:tetratricopeptide (TPR) repeat protein
MDAVLRCQCFPIHRVSGERRFGDCAMAKLESLSGIQCDENKPHVIFVHGLRGDGRETWMSDANEAGTHWPQWVRDAGFPVWLVHYDAEISKWASSSMSLQNQGETILDLLACRPELKNKRLVFVGHSLGGLVIKSALTTGVACGDSRFEELVGRTAGVVFIATPHQGAQLANLISVFRSTLRVNQVVLDMARYAPHLNHLNATFRALHHKGGLKVRSFAETKPVTLRSSFLGGLAVAGKTVVMVADSDPHVVGAIVIPLQEDHFSIAKPEDKESHIHLALLDFLSEIPASPPPGMAPPRNSGSQTQLSLSAPAHHKVFTAGLPYTNDRLIGRSEELKLMTQCWESKNKKICMLSAPGGVGKSSIVIHWLNSVLAGDPTRVPRIFAWSFYSQGNPNKPVGPDEFLSEAWNWFKVEKPRGTESANAKHLAEAIASEPSILILDGLEPLQHPPGHDEGRLRDEARTLHSLLLELARIPHRSLCVITTRLEVSDLRPHIHDSVISIELGNLSPRDGAELLATLQVTGERDDLECASAEFGGHALALTLLASYLGDIAGGKADIRRIGEVGRLQDDERLGGHARRVMRAYEKWFGPGPELDMLHLLGLFDRPATRAALDVLRAQPAIAGLTDALASLGPIAWNRNIAKLKRARLVSDPTDDLALLDAHPIVREYFGEKVRQNFADAWLEGHRRLYQHCRSLSTDKPSDFYEMMPVWEAVVHACDAGLHEEGLALYKERILQGNSYFSTYKLGAFGNEMTLLSRFFESEWDRPVKSLPPVEQAFILQQTGYCQRARGLLTEAVRWLESALRQYEAIGKEDKVAELCSLLCPVYISVGDLRSARRHADESVRLSGSLSVFLRWVNLTKLADVSHNCGLIDESRAFFEQAEALLKTEHPDWYIFGVAGYRYLDLLLTEGKFDEVEKRASWLLQWVLDNPTDASATPLTIALANLALGQATLLRKSPDSLKTGLSKVDTAVEYFRQADRQDFLVPALLIRADVRSEDGDRDAYVDFDDAERLYTRGAMQLAAVDGHIVAARMALRSGGLERARHETSLAAQEMRKTGYLRRRGEIESLQRQLAQSPKRP